MKSGVLEKAMPGRENAKDWLTIKIVECLAQPMDDEIAEQLAAYNSAYNAICQWNDDPEPVIAPKPEATDSDINPEDAKLWMKNLKNADGTSGAHWTLDQTKEIMAKRSLSLNPYEFWIALNVIYSDFSPVAKKHGVGGSMDYYVDMAKAFLNDKNAAPGKLSNYYNSIVK